MIIHVIPKVELRNMTERLELIEDKLIMNGLITDD